MISTVIFHLSKEYPRLARDEIICCLQAEGHQFQTIRSNENIFMITIDISNEELRHVALRLSMSFSIGQVLFTSEPSIDAIKKKAKENPIHCTGSIAVKYKNRSQTLQSKPFVQSVADVYTQKRIVDLSNPDNVIYLLLTDKKIYVSKQIAIINRGAFEKRKAHLRPFFSPISLHPRIARFLVNISTVKAGDTLFDPFCGTGGILIEAGLMHIKIIGNDISENMINGSKKNFAYYEVTPEQMFTEDISFFEKDILNDIDAVVTDFPYGKAASTQGESIKTLHKRSFHIIEKVLKPNGKAVIGTASKELKDIHSKKMNHKNSYPLRIHRSLTRWFHVFERIP